jgi:hypothetical protein
MEAAVFFSRTHVPTQGHGVSALSFQMKKTTALVVLPAGGGLIYFECSELGGGDLAHIELRIAEREHFVPDGE